MKKYYFLFVTSVLLFSGTASHAQITINSNDLPSAGSMYHVSNGQAFSGMNPAATGANHSWDYSQLTYSSQTVDTFASVLSTGLFLIWFSSSSFALKSNTASVNLGLLTIDYQYDFFKKTSSSYVQTGSGINMSGAPVPLTYSPKDTVYRFPLQYNAIHTTASSFSVSIPTLGYYGGDKTRTDTVDGWGMLTTPFGTFSTLRVKSVINERDSIHVDTIIHFGFALPRPQVIEYKWLGTGKGLPLLQINTTAGAVTQIVYLDSVRTMPSSVNDLENNGNDFSTYPNPSSAKMFVSFYLEKPKETIVELYTLTGQKLYSETFSETQTGKNILAIDLSGWKYSSGTYLVRLTIDGKSFQKEIVRQ